MDKNKTGKRACFLKEKQAAFAFTGYEFGDSEGRGKRKGSPCAGNPHL